MTAKNGRRAAAADANPYAALPSVASLLALAKERGGSGFTDVTLTTVFQDVLTTARAEIAAGARPNRREVVARALAVVAALACPRLSPVLNATGVIVHTNLGRAPVSDETASAMAVAAGGAVPLEIEPETGLRGGRLSEISTLLRLLTGAEATLVVNNNAAAVLLTLSAIAAGRGVIVSRGEAIEIGGGFRIPDVLRQSGATLVEVGTTNRTYISDYAEAVDETTAALLKVHPSNFRITGFTASPGVAQLAELATANGLPVIEDLGSGALIDVARFGLAAEPTIKESLEAGATIVTASGDKLLGGPQAGLIVGSGAWIKRIEAHPLARAVRADKTCLAGLAATLRHYARGEAEGKIPVWQMIAAQSADLKMRAESVAGAVATTQAEIAVVATEAAVGGGSLPGQTLPSWAVSIATNVSTADDLARRLRLGAPAVYGRVEGERVVLDLRSVMPRDDERLVGALRAALNSAA